MGLRHHKPFWLEPEHVQAADSKNRQCSVYRLASSQSGFLQLPQRTTPQAAPCCSPFTHYLLPLLLLLPRFLLGPIQAASAFAKQAVRLSTASAALFETVGSTWEDVTSPDADWQLVQVITP
jgi:hypothetical protein